MTFNPATIPIIIENIALALFSLVIYKKVRTRGDMTMARMKLSAEKTVTEFKALLYLHGFEAGVMALVLYGSLIEKSMLIDIGILLSAGYGVGMTIVFYRWWRRFTK